MEERDRVYVPLGVERYKQYYLPPPPGDVVAWVVSYDNYRWERRSIISYGADELGAYAHALKLLNRLRKRADKRKNA